MNGEPQDSTTSSRPTVEGLRSVLDQDVHNDASRGAYSSPRMDTRREHSDGDSIRVSATSNGSRTVQNPASVANQAVLQQQQHDPHQFTVPPRMDSLISSHEQARAEMRRRATVMLLQRQREQQSHLHGGRQMDTDSPLTQVPYASQIRRDNLSTVDMYGRSGPNSASSGPRISDLMQQGFPISHRTGDQASTYIPPRWQPDAEVTNCPICNHPFSFFFRKHHCRKCGRVVCANCSPHRITIPRQYIVNAPAVHPIEIDLTNDTSDRANPAAALAADQMYPGLEGQEVRLCNPCVPDPHPFSPPPYSETAPTFARPAASRRLPSDSLAAGRRRSHHAGSVPLDYARYHAIQTNPATMYRSGVPYQPHPTVISAPSPYGSAPDSASMYVPRHGQSHGHPRSHRHYASLSALPSSRSRAVFEAMTSTEEPPTIEPPSRQIPEEDECPICHEELPPKGPDGSEIDRETHVTQCIEGHFSSSRPRESSMPDPRTAVAAAVVASAVTPSQAGSSIPIGVTAGPSIRRRTTGMVIYNASEKDCVGEDGGSQECIICFEDFEPGAEMGRLECLCKFHKTCIRSWWDTKGVGACPVHQGGLI